MRKAVPAMLLVLVLAGCAGPGPDGEGAGAADPGEGALAPDAEAGVLSGSLSAVGSSTSQPISIATDHERFSFVLVLTSNLPQTNLGLNVTGPDGRSDEVRTGPTLYVLPGGRPAMSFGSPMVGDWVAQVELRSGASAEYEVHWCADDGEAPGPQDNLACQREFS